MALSTSASDGVLDGAGPGKGEAPDLPRLKPKFSGRTGLAIVILAVVCGLATYAILTGLTPIQPARPLVIGLLIMNAVLVAAMAAITGWQLWGLLEARRRRIAGAGLHARIVALLSVSALVPALIVAIFASVTLNRGLDAWFSERTRSIVDTAVTVAEAFLQEQGDVARGDIIFIANDLEQQSKLFEDDRQAFIRRLATHAAFRSLSGAFVINSKERRVVASVTANDRVTFRPPEEGSLAAADRGELVIEGPGNGNVIRALLKLKAFSNHYLYVYRLVNPEVIAQLSKAKDEKAAYDQLLNQRSGVQVTFALVYAGVTFIFLLAAVYLGLWFSDRIVEPVVSLVDAARRVSRGELDAKVSVVAGSGDLATLSQTFNRMTDQLQAQRDELVSANQLLDNRRRFTEAVLAGVSAGVVGVDPMGVVTLVNRSAIRLTGLKRAALIGKPFAEVLPSMREIFADASEKRSGSAEGHVTMRVDNQDRNFIVRVTTEWARQDEQGHVVTFDDITELVSAQRNSAWADIARRIAHEIKNPLTPIQLSAERLKRKYGKEISTDPQVFQQCTDTIIRQVGDIGRMVDEFSSFARMPSASLEPADLVAVVKEALVLQRVSAEDTIFETDGIPDDAIVFPFDRRLVTQAVTNLVKNAREAIEARIEQNSDPAPRIRVSITETEGEVRINVADNGVGLPKENRNRLTEPYMTTREKGTGLGLAIVKRIMEEHHGRVMLSDAPEDLDGGQGALVSLIFTRNELMISEANGAGDSGAEHTRGE